MLKYIFGYIVLGQIITWGTVGFSIWRLVRKCADHEGVLTQLTGKYCLAPDAPVRMSESQPILAKLRIHAVNLLLWPRKVVLLLCLLRCQLRDADALIRARAVSALYPET